MDSSGGSKHAIPPNRRKPDGRTNVSTGRLLHDVIKYLEKTRRGVTPEEVKEKLSIDIKNDTELLESLKNNPKVFFEDGIFSYKVFLLCILLVPLVSAAMSAMSICTFSSDSRESIFITKRTCCDI
mmetsp:Transcript_18358/g.30174  ORF Transcript_18358/g.30174 Transcript_18358/m.30174 type:complete len:126 (-) Transcript_18358:542-919(-)